MRDPVLVNIVMQEEKQPDSFTLSIGKPQLSLAVPITLQYKVLIFKGAAYTKP